MKLNLKKVDAQEDKAVVENMGEKQEEMTEESLRTPLEGTLKASLEETLRAPLEECMEEVKDEEVVAVAKKEEKLSDYLRRITGKHASNLYQRMLDETVKAANEMEIEAKIVLSDKEAKISPLVIERLEKEGLNVEVSGNEVAIGWL